MATTLSKCPTCGYPLTAEYEGQTAVCAYCGEKVEAVISQGVIIPTPLLVGVISFALGVLIGPGIIASTKAGQDWLVKQARERIK